MNFDPGLGFMIFVDFTNLILRHGQTPKTCHRLVLIYNRFVDLQQNCRFTTTMNPDPVLQPPNPNISVWKIC